MTTRGLAALGATWIAVAAPGAHAAGGPIDDVLALVDEALHCGTWADEPGGDPIVGSGGGRCGFANVPVTVVVCLDYNGITLAATCTTYRGSGSAGGSSNSHMCVPGLWQTQVTMVHAAGPDSRIHSDPVLLTCLP